MRAAFVLAVFATFFTVFAAEPSGMFKTLKGEITVIRGDAKLKPKIGEKFFEKDVITSGANGSAGLIFSDDTLVSIGPNSELSVKEYLFEPSEKRTAFTTSLTKGSMACMTGLIAKINPNSMKVQVKTATMGIRGTYFIAEAGE